MQVPARLHYHRRIGFHKLMFCFHLRCMNNRFGHILSVEFFEQFQQFRLEVNERLIPIEVDCMTPLDYPGWRSLKMFKITLLRIWRWSRCAKGE
ncbi:hypothetical protein Dimus_015756 [Dionaea muscipula]